MRDDARITEEQLKRFIILCYKIRENSTKAQREHIKITYKKGNNDLELL